MNMMQEIVKKRANHLFALGLALIWGFGVPLGVAAVDSHAGHDSCANAISSCGTSVADADSEHDDEVHDEEQEDDHSGHDHGGHGCEGGVDALSLSLDEIAIARCEHDTEAYRCKACRYEVGVVKVSETLMKRADGTGLIRTGTTARQTISPELRSTGEIQLNRNATVHVTPRIQGIIASVAVDLGAHVKAGDLLCEINSTELGNLVAEYLRSQTLTELAKKTYDREKSLFDRKITSEQELIEAQMEYEKHRIELISAKQTLHVLGITEKELKERETGHGTQLGLLPVRASIDGTVLEKHAVVGELVEPGSEIMLLADLTTLWVWIDVYERDLDHLLKAGEDRTIPITVTSRAFPDRYFKGVIDYLGSTMHEGTRTVKVRGIVQNTDGLLRPGMFCQATVASGESEDILAIPVEAVLSDEGASFVFKHWKDDYYVRRAATVGRTFDGHVEVLDGVMPGDTIVTGGAFLLKSDVLREKMGAGCAD